MLLLLALLVVVPTAAAFALNTTSGPCAPASCGGLTITYPFWLTGSHSPECGYKDFQVNCDKGEASLENTIGTYKILDIFYKNSSFRVANVNVLDGSCDINGSSDLFPLPFQISAQNLELFFLYNCSQQARQLPQSWAPVSCANHSANNSTFAWLGGKYRTGSNFTQLPGNCSVSMMPVLGYAGAAGADYQRLVKAGFLLEYAAGDCEACKETGGWCRVNGTDDLFERHCSYGVDPLLLCVDGKFYNGDAGYPNRHGYLTPYKSQRYHILDWRRGPAARGEQELFNHLHSSVRNCVERAFGVWKNKWRILLKMPKYPMDKQMMIVTATMCLHNYIRENDAQDKDFTKCDRDPDYVPTIPSRYSKYLPPANASDTSTPASNEQTMDRFRDDLARAIYLSRST